MTLSPVRDAHDVISHFVAIKEDVTDRERTAAVFEQQAALLALAPVAIIVRDLEDRVTFWNPGAQAFYGWSAAEAEGQVVHELLHTVFPKSLEEDGDAVRREGIWDGELRHRTLTGVEVVVASRQAVLRDSSGVPTAILEVNSDVTERSRAEAALRESEERFRLLMEGVTDHAILLLTPQGCVSSWNSGAERLLGYTADEILGEHIARFHPVESQQRHWPDQLLERAEAAGSETDFGWRIRRDGSQFWADDVITALRDEDGRLRGFAKVTRDISSRKEAEDAQRRHAEYQASIIQVQADIARAELDPEKLMHLVAEQVQRLTNASGASVELLDDTGRQLSVAAASGVASSLCELRMDLETSLSGQSVLHDRVLTGGDAPTDASVDVVAARAVGVQSMVAAPVKDERRTIGTLKIVSLHAHAFDVQHGGTLQLLAGFLGAVLGRAQASAALIRAEKAAQAAAERFGSVLRAATECSIIGTDLNGTITVFNKGSERMLGYAAEELIGLATSAWLHDPTELAQRAAALHLANPHEALFAAWTRSWKPRSQRC